jgi:hypothetical protein
VEWDGLAAIVAAPFLFLPVAFQLQHTSRFYQLKRIKLTFIVKNFFTPAFLFQSSMNTETKEKKKQRSG